MLIFICSGTTGKPKGVVHTHANIEAMITALVRAWGWSSSDRTYMLLLCECAFMRVCMLFKLIHIEVMITAPVRAWVVLFRSYAYDTL